MRRGRVPRFAVGPDRRFSGARIHGLARRKFAENNPWKHIAQPHQQHRMIFEHRFRARGKGRLAARFRGGMEHRGAGVQKVHGREVIADHARDGFPPQLTVEPGEEAGDTRQRLFHLARGAQASGVSQLCFEIVEMALHRAVHLIEHARGVGHLEDTLVGDLPRDRLGDMMMGGEQIRGVLVNRGVGHAGSLARILNSGDPRQKAE